VEGKQQCALARNKSSTLIVNFGLGMGYLFDDRHVEKSVDVSIMDSDASSAPKTAFENMSSKKIFESLPLAALLLIIPVILQFGTSILGIFCTPVNATKLQNSCLHLP